MSRVLTYIVIVLGGVNKLVNETDNKYKAKGKKIFIVLSVIVFVSVVYVTSYFLGKTLNFGNKHASANLKVEATSEYKNTEVDIQKDKDAKVKNAMQVQNNTVNKQSSDNKNLIALADAEKPLRVEVNLKEQMVYVYDAKSRMVENFVCSSGIDGSDTPTGEYKVKERGYSFYSDKYQEGAYYWVQFMGNYLFHSVPFDKNQVIEQGEVKKLGTKASHGCVRLAIQNAKWMYDNIPRDTLVTIK